MWPAVRGNVTGSLPPGFTAPLSTSAIAAAPSSPGSHTATTAAHRSCASTLPHGRPATSTSTTGVPVARTARRRSSCTPGRSSDDAIPALAACRIDREARLVAHHHHGEVGFGGQPDRFVEAVAIVAVDRTARAVRTVAVGNAAADRREHGPVTDDVDVEIEVVGNRDVEDVVGRRASRAATRRARRSCSRRTGCADRRHWDR